VAALGLTLAATPAGARTAAPASARAGDICLYTGANYSGRWWCWRPGNGYVDVPPYLHDNVGSFVARANGCFINWISVPHHKQTRRVLNGDYRRDYKSDFGGKIDAIAPTC
jgi:hypothetical protein